MVCALAIEIEGLTKTYGSMQALRGVNLNVRRGEMLGFLGPNGAGKTTTIRCLLDLIRPQAGNMQVLGIDPRKDPVGVRARVVEAIAERVAIIRQGVIVEEAEPDRLLNMSVRRFRLRFREPVNLSSLTSLAGVSLVQQTSDLDIILQVEGDVDHLVKALGAFPVSDLQSDHLSLEEVFLAYYKEDKEGGTQ
ncbi:MAG: ATP-binding cassette domain-containing protein [Clostridiales bacterium]|jgi:ABC-type multidrug transport system ATPase subunit|nr:ATP-binding cassette domain-containing protein [Clostridiales bacterium]MBS4031463.1 ATP-binding cassette domain-containing protein [Clostridiales bacterium]